MIDYVVTVRLFKTSEETSQEHLAARPPNPSTALKVETFDSHATHVGHAKQRAANLFVVMRCDNAGNLEDGEKFFAWVNVRATYSRHRVDFNYRSSFLLFALPSGLHRELDVVFEPGF
jgi:hypothetical protein